MKNLKDNLSPTPKICIIGAGLSGMCAAIQLKTKLGLNSFTIFEMNSDVGGVWFANSYPGCTCDVPIHYYSFSFEPNPDWSSNYCSQQEILTYLKNVAVKYDLYAKMRLRTEVKSLLWVENIKKWKTTVIDLQSTIEVELLFDLVINGPGNFRQPKIPEVFQSFQGPMIHSARWNPEIELVDKIVAVVGTGSSAIQLIPNVAGIVKELHIYQREPPYVLPLVIPQFKFPQAIKWIFAIIPGLMWILRVFIFGLIENLHRGFKFNSFASRFYTKLALNNMKHQLPNNAEIQTRLTPNYKFGCKAAMVSNNYFSTIGQPHVYIHSSQVMRVEENTLITEDGSRKKIDVIILATGFQVLDYFAPMTIIGKNSENILSKWKEEGPRSYFGIVSSKMPNYFHLMGPHGNLAHQSILFTIECQVNFILKIISEMMTRNTNSFNLKQDAEDEYMQFMEDSMKYMVWPNDSCNSWFKDSRGVTTIKSPWSGIYYWMKTRNVDFSKFNFTQNESEIGYN